ncbi:uncharacterized protein LACBIDRAFT_230018 [Laccaria bicolor S238N-H82]|uniref:Predicted protein n=1 Tax=Laccaria bicolor (strain S238N-H82 / ATCC MYA-4686) TaxID=486041 RepID=B0CT77_LACBS|nr:uncharacterized protein LACBIDRAFT_230018 [Laccaria bicolor S238N-H82]EDR14936.1 predicted protein [Laccaria bicolor S238N-H82]|eukprot:XP_001875495.1 predicted protein [Laccaria bicolor S238N-H82]
MLKSIQTPNLRAPFLVLSFHHPYFLPCSPKPPVVRGARACTVCRAAKASHTMKCVGAEDGQKSCQRCKRANAECVFEKHRRGRKPGSKLSEASKVLRRLEKGLHSAKLKSPSADSALASPYQSSDIRVPPPQEISYPGPRSEPSYGPPNTHFPTNELPPLTVPTYQNGDAYASSSKGSRSMDVDDDEEDPDRNEEDFFPAKLIRRENRRNSFFRTILNPNPEEAPAAVPVTPNRGSSFTPPQIQLAPCPGGLSDPITAGILTEKDAETLFDCIYLRLNPFINLFDPALHTVPYVRSKCPFLFTTLLMAACKFFKADSFKPCQKLANEFAVVQAFACLTYWKDPDDNRTWTYIGYACRMAVELGLNRYVAHPAPSETQLQRLERRNRERTYLVLFVHDRSLSTQTGRHWMLPEDDLIKHSNTWHMGNGGKNIRPEDVIIAAFVSLRRIAAETTDIFSTSRSAASGVNTDINYEVVLRNCNDKLNQWDETWRTEMERAGGESFHTSFLALFRLYVRLFLNSFGIHASIRQSPSLGVLSICCTSALDSLKIVSNDFVKLSMLRYGQDTITVMTAYSAVFLLKVLYNIERRQQSRSFITMFCSFYGLQIPIHN